MNNLGISTITNVLCHVLLKLAGWKILKIGSCISAIYLLSFTVKNSKVLRLKKLEFPLFLEKKDLFISSMLICYSIKNFLFALGFKSHPRIFQSYGNVTITKKGLQILTCDRHSWPLSSERTL